MTTFDRESLVAAAGIDPWGLRDKFTAGDPEEIYAMAKAFNAAADEQGDAVTLTTKGLETAGDGYKVNNATPIDVSAEVAQAKKDLGGGGEKLGKIAKILSDVASDLVGRTNTANSSITTLEGDINTVIGSWNTDSADYKDLPSSDYSSVREGYVQKAVQKVKDAGGPIKTSVDDYEEALAGHLKAMADLGYIPSSDLDEGPGDVDVPDPTKAGNGTVDATKESDPDKAKEMFGANTAYLDLLNRKQAAGVPLTEAEKQWLKDYYEVVTPHFGEIKDWADKLVGVEPGQKPDQNDPTVKLVSRVGDGFLNLSQNVPYDELPQSAKDILAGNLGVTDSDDQQYMWFGTPGERHAADWPPNGDPNLTKFAGFTGLLNDYSSDSVAPSNDLASHLADASLRWKQQINTMYVNYQADYEIAKGYDQGGHKLSEDEWNKLFPDELASDGLGVVARNREFSNDWIVDNAEDRRTIMGSNWQSGQGAADVLLSASIPGNGLSGEDASKAGLAIVQDASSDYNGLAKMANTQVKAAIGDVGLAYIDSFAKDPSTTSPSISEITLPNGDKVPGFLLDEGTKDNFLKFVAASDPTVYQHFREGTLTRGTWYLEEVMKQGHTDPSDPVYQQAMRDAVRLTSGADAAAAGVLIDAANEGASQDEVQKKAEDLAYAQAMSDYNAKKGAVDTVSNIFSVAGLMPFPPGVKTGVSVGSTAWSMFTNAVLQAPPAPDQNHYITNLQDYVQNLANGHVAENAARSQVQDNITTMIVNASDHSGHPIVDPSTGKPVVPMDNGKYPEGVRSDIYNELDNYTVDLGADTVSSVIAASDSSVDNPDAHGPGARSQFGDSSGTQPDKVGTLGDSSGNWSDADNQYRIYYGDETRWRYHEPTTWDGAYVAQDVPDDKDKTETFAPAVPGAK